jgi:UDP-N-acetylmuramoyl-tripeptide--D-alanyl-D-alanine ligase
MLTALSLSIISAASIMFFSRRLLRYLYHFQEGGYSRRSFTKWMIDNGIYDRKGTVIAAITAAILEFLKPSPLIESAICAIAGIGLVSLGFWEADPRKEGDTRLQETVRSAGIYNLALGLYSIGFTIAVYAIHRYSKDDDLALYWIAVIVAIQSAPIWPLVARSIRR